MKPKTITSYYYLSINDNLLTDKLFDTLKSARKYVKSLTLNESIQTVKIIKETIKHTVIDTYSVKIEKTLSADQLGID